MSAAHRGRVWKFGDDINTDLITPGFALFKPVAEQPRYCFSANRPGWAEQVRPGDLIVAGDNFGTGSGRPIGQVFAGLGIAGILAESFNGLGLRNLLNSGVAAQPAPGVTELFEEGDVAEIDWGTGAVRNVTTGASASYPPLPAELLAIVTAGGLLAVLEGEGFLRQP